MIDFKRLREWHEGKADSQFGHSPMTTDDDWMMHAETARILSVLLRVREGCDFGPLRELNDGRPDVLCLDFTGPAEPLRRLAELLGGEK